MAELVNLRQFRKRKKRKDEAESAEKNRDLHGISTKLKKQARQQNELEKRRHDGKSRPRQD
jgi:hypothetical protein